MADAAVAAGYDRRRFRRMRLLPLTAGIVCGAGLTGRIIVRTGRPTDIPKIGLPLSAVALGILRSPLATSGCSSAWGSRRAWGSAPSCPSSRSSPRPRPARPASAPPQVPSRARTLGSALGASAFGALIFGLIGGSCDMAALQDPGVQAGVHMAFRFAFLAAAAACLLAAWTASRVPSLRFTEELGRAEAVGE